MFKPRTPNNCWFVFLNQQNLMLVLEKKAINALLVSTYVCFSIYGGLHGYVDFFTNPYSQDKELTSIFTLLEML